MPAAAHQQMLLALVLLPAAPVAGWEDCSSENLRNCSLPRWGASWDMASSLYVYCFGHCPLASLANQTHLGNFSGVVGVDHYWTKQGMPCVDGEPTEFANQDAFAIKWKTTFPGTRVLEYRITDAVFYDPLVYDKMQTDPDFFVRFKNGSVCQTAPKAGTGMGPAFGNCKWPVTSAAWDWSQEKVRDWYLEKIIKPTMIHADGVWLDGDGPDNGAYECSGSHNYNKLLPPYPALKTPAEIAKFCAGEALVTAAADEWLIANKGYNFNCIFFISGEHGKSVPNANDTSAVCAKKLTELAAYNMTNQAIGLYGSRVGATLTSGPKQDYSLETAAQAVAVFMLTRQEHWYFVLPESDIPPSLAALVLTDFGPPLGNMTAKGTVFSRAFAKKIVSLDCASFEASFEEAA